MKTARKALVLVLAALLALAGCGGNESWAYEYKGEQMPAGVYISYLMAAMGGAQEKLMEERYRQGNYESITQKELLASTIDDMPAEEWVAAEAQKNALVHYAVIEQAGERGLALSEEQQASLTASIDNAWASYQAIYEQNGIAKTSMHQVQEVAYLKDLLFTALYGTEGEQPVTEKDVEDFFVENYATAEYIMLPLYVPSDQADAQLAAEENAKAAQDAEDLRQRLADGEAIEVAYYEYQLADAAEDEKEFIAQREHSSFVITVGIKDQEYYQEGFVDALVAAKIGEPAVVETEAYLFVVNRLEPLANGLPYSVEALRSEMKADEFDAWLEELAAEMGIQANQAALSRYTPEKLKSE